MDPKDDRTGPSTDRRTVLNEVTVASSACLGTTTFDGMAATQGLRSFVAEQGDDLFYVRPLSYGSPDVWTVEEFYGYDDPEFASANTPSGLERAGVSNLFLYRGPRGVSLVVIHDAHDGDGGSVSFEFAGLPGESGDWVVEDGPGDPGRGSAVNWRWPSRCTDGGAFRGGLDGDFAVTIDPRFGGWFDDDWLREWHLLSGDASDPERIPLDPEAPVTIRPSYLQN